MQIAGKACSDSTVPICATGARIIVTLLAALRRYDLKRGTAAVGGGEAMANAIGQLDGPGGTI